MYYSVNLGVVGDWCWVLQTQLFFNGLDQVHASSIYLLISRCWPKKKVSIISNADGDTLFESCRRVLLCTVTRLRLVRLLLSQFDFDIIVSKPEVRMLNPLRLWVVSSLSCIHVSLRYQHIRCSYSILITICFIYRTFRLKIEHPYLAASQSIMISHGLHS